MLGKPFEGALALAGQWELQARVLQWYEQAAKRSGDQKALGYALHQLGTREICLGNFHQGRNLLTQASKLRKAWRDQEAVKVTQHNLGILLRAESQAPSFLKRIIIPASITSILVLGGVSLLGYKLLKAQQEITSFYQDNQKLEQEIASLKDKQSTSSNRESELMVTIETINKERDSLKKEIDYLNKKAEDSDKKARDTRQEIEALKNRTSSLNLNGTMRPLAVDVETCRAGSLRVLEEVVAEDWGQGAEVQDMGENGSTVSTGDKRINLMCMSTGNGSVVGIFSASNTPDEARRTIQMTMGISQAFDVYR